MSQNVKQTIIAVVIVIIAFFGFKAFFSDSQTADSTLVAESAATSQFVDGQSILVLLNKLNSVVLDDTIYSDKVFTSLEDFEKPIADQVAGRPNPFLPIGVDVGKNGTLSGTSTSRTVGTSTVRTTNIR